MQIVTFIDHIGRTIVGEAVEYKETTVLIKNPAIIHTQPTPQGQLNVQTIPLYFREFVSEKNKIEGTIWEFNRTNIVLGVNVENDERLMKQYQAIFNPPVAQPNSNIDLKTIRLFDE